MRSFAAGDAGRCRVTMVSAGRHGERDAGLRHGDAARREQRPGIRPADVNLDTWLVYLLAALGLSLSPGPNGLLALTHGAMHGLRRTLFTVFGGAVGFFGLYAVSMFGIGAVIAASPVGLAMLKWAGGAYLVWLGLQVWRAPPIAMTLSAAESAAESASISVSVSGTTLFRQGAMCALTNPKGLLFLIAFLPQFVDPARSLWWQFVVMASTFVVIEIATEALIAGSAHALKAWLARVGRRFNQCCGALFMLVGMALPLR